MNPLLETCSSLRTDIPIFTLTADGCVSAYWEGDSYVGSGESPIPWEELREYGATKLVELDPLLTRLDAGPFVVQPSLGWESELSIFAQITAAKHFQAMAMLGLHDGDRAGAASWLRRSLRLQRAIERHPGLIHQIGHLALGAINFRTTWAVLEGTDWTDKELAAIDASWKDARLAEALADALQGERAQMLAIFPGGAQEAYAQARGGMPGFVVSGFGGEPRAHRATGVLGHLAATLREVPRRTLETTWRTAWSHGDKLAYAQTMQSNLDSIRAMIRDRHSASSFSAALPFRTPPTLLEQITRPVSVNIIPKVFDVSNSSAMAETQRNLVRAAIALKRFKLRHQRLPASLDELVPDLLEELPWDWQAGQPLTYRLREDGSWLLYGWGENEADDGGDPGTGGWPYGPDLVWVFAAAPDQEE
jgi:hypothetical protein